MAQSGAVRLVVTATGFGIASGTFGGGLIATGADGTQKWALTVSGPSSKSLGSGGIVALSDGLVWLGSGYPNGTGKGIRLVRTNNVGTVVLDVGFAAGEVAVNSAIKFSGGLLVGGSSNWTGWVHRTDLKGKVMWSKDYGGLVNGLTALKDGFLIAGSKGGSSQGIRHAWIGRAATDGKTVWSKMFPTPYAGATAIVALPDGVAVVGWINGLVPNANNGDDFWMIRADAVGNLLWNRGYDLSGVQRAGALVALSDGFALAGGSAGNGQSGGRILRTDVFGNATCADSGACITKTLTNCDDSNACTIDLCTAAKGCTHDKAPNGIACATGKTCAAGVCGG